ncbi:MAG: hypothetical protein IPO91_03345 [Chloroflexi bacterium]|nr:hypothetical protein [Chloroflexota bacterium]
MTKSVVFFLLLLWLALPAVAQTTNPIVEVVLSTDQAQQGDTVYADVVIRNGQAVAGADIGITADTCLRITDRQLGAYLPATGEMGGFSPFAEQTDTSTRFAASVTDRARVANGDGTFYRAVMTVTCDQADPQVYVTFAEVASLAAPGSASNELLGYSLERGNLSIVNDALAVQPGAVAATPVPIQAYAVPALQSRDNLLMIVALGMVGVAVVGLLILMIVYRRRSLKRGRFGS